MSTFNEFKKAIKNYAESILGTHGRIYIARNAGGEILYQLYLEECTKYGENEIYKTRGAAECNCCKSFIRHYGALMVITSDLKILTIWDAPNLPAPYDKIAKEMSAYVHKYDISDVFFAESQKLGTDITIGDAMQTWQHLFCTVPRAFVKAKHNIPTLAGEARTEYQVFKRALEEISVSSIETVLELIASQSLYRGADYKAQLDSFLALKREFDTIPTDKRSPWLWTKAAGNFVSRIRNTAIGTLLVDLSNNVDINEAVTKFERMMAPANYKRPKAIYTPAMIKAAQDTINELGFGNSLARRFAAAADISVNNVIYVDRNTAPKMKDGDLLADILQVNDQKRISKKELDRAEEMSAEEFIEKIVPTCSSIDIFFDKQHQSNLFSLIAPSNADAKTMFKWNNNFSWVYNGNITDSMKELVKAAGGKVDGPLRFSISWNQDKKTESDLDAHCKEPCGHMFFVNRHHALPSTCILDVDIVSPAGETAVENITWSDRRRMKDGLYEFSVHVYNKRNGTGGFSAEIEFDGEIYQYSVPSFRNGETIPIATVQKKGDTFTIVKSIEGTLGAAATADPIWNIVPNTFNKVSMATLSPNFWDDNKVGNKHYMFVIDKCINPESPRGLFNEFLKGELDEHKRVFEALGEKLLVPKSPDQLSGLGFSVTKREKVIFRVVGNYQRLIKVCF